MLTAKYDDGTFAGSHERTAFKEYDKDGQRVTLTLHHWSGTKAGYHVAKSSGIVAGATA